MSQTLEQSANALQTAVKETSGTALTISPKEDKWSGYLLQQKKSFEESSLSALHTKMTEYIVANRALNEKFDPAKPKAKVKQYKFEKK